MHHNNKCPRLFRFGPDEGSRQRPERPERPKDEGQRAKETTTNDNEYLKASESPQYVHVHVRQVGGYEDCGERPIRGYLIAISKSMLV